MELGPEDVNFVHISDDVIFSQGCVRRWPGG